jgi:hypothetical protein
MLSNDPFVSSEVETQSARHKGFSTPREGTGVGAVES